MRQIVLDTETTGLDPRLGHRVIEIGGVELVNRRLTNRHFHTFLDPEREIDPEATKVHGMTWEDLKGKPRFADRVAQFIEFIKDAELVIHNAAFDVGFLDAELAMSGLPPLPTHCAGVLDTLRMAKDLHPGKRNNLDVLCERYAVNNSGRALHGALLDAGLLADVYLAMTRGQESLAINLDEGINTARAFRRASGERPPLFILGADAGELAEHAAYLELLDRESRGMGVWTRLLATLTASPEPEAEAAAV
ncbi:MAG: DNA polymerase III subunit epsilon [Betaproteobacteria bacterium]